MWVRPWLRAYVQAPFGAAGAVLLSWAVIGGIDPYSRSIWLPIGYIAVVLPFAYAAGLFLLPVFLIYERLRWRGARFYVPTAVVAGLLTMGVMQPPESRAAGPGGLILGALCALGSGIVFSVRLRLPA